MTDRPTYHTGARKLEPRHGADPHDDFDQDAAANRKPAPGAGLSENPSLERSESDKSDLRDRSEHGSPEADARGQSESRHKGGTNDGMSSANPRVLSERDDGDVTFPVDHKPAR